MAHPKHIAHPGHIAPSQAVARPKRIVAPESPERSIKVCLNEAPWATIALLILVLILVMALWGKVAWRWKPPHQAPSGNGPSSSSLFFDHSPDRALDRAHNRALDRAHDRALQS